MFCSNNLTWRYGESKTKQRRKHSDVRCPQLILREVYYLWLKDKKERGNQELIGVVHCCKGRRKGLDRLESVASFWNESAISGSYVGEEQDGNLVNRAFMNMRAA